MNNWLISFKSIPWKIVSMGAKQKVVQQSGMQLRLLQFDDTFVEKDWCTKGHMGYVLKGTMTINFNGHRKIYVPGDGLCIPEGETSKHKVEIEKSKFVELILFESVF